MKLNGAVLMLLPLLFVTFGTACITQLAYGDGVAKPIAVRLYWDQECIHPVFSIDFGMVRRGESKSLGFWVKNQGTGKGRISWDSANFNPSSGWAIETWERKVGKFVYIANWHEKMKTGDLWETRYSLQVGQDAQVGSYSWDLIVCLIVSEKANCLSVVCCLAVTQ